MPEANMNDINLNADNRGEQSDKIGEGQGGDFLFDLLGKIMSGRGNDSAQASGNGENKQNLQSEQKNSSTGDILSSLLSNPELISKLPQILSALGPLMSGLGGSSHQTGNTDTNASAQTFAQQNPQPAAPPPSKKNDYDSRAALLCAMKPYLGAERQNAIDYIIKLSRLGDILKTL